MPFPPPKTLGPDEDVSPVIRGTLSPFYLQGMARSPEGGTSTVRTIGVGIPSGEALIPTVSGGDIMSDDAAINKFRQTGGHYGVYADQYKAAKAAELLHQMQAALAGINTP